MTSINHALYDLESKENHCLKNKFYLSFKLCITRELLSNAL